MRPIAAVALFGLCLLPGLSAQSSDPDRDGDGLPDFQEVHKYLTDPAKADSDGDGIEDGDWDERREYAYTVRTIVQAMRPVDVHAANDDQQDARALDATDDYVELEVIHYPLNTAGREIAADPHWRRHVEGLKRWLAPGPTANWDEELRTKLTAAVRKDGIDPDQLDDKTLVERASRWLLEHARYADGFTTFSTAFKDGRPYVPDALRAAAGRGIAASGLTLETQWERELFAKGMFEHGTRGSCTSTAIYLTGCLRALGVPTRIVLCIPAVDANDEREVGWVQTRLRHRKVQTTIAAGIAQAAGKWASHTFNEVFVGGRWRRLNFNRLGQPSLDAGCFGLMTHIATFHDWADADMPSTVGRRQGLEITDDAFGGRNPYSCITLSDRFGAHCKIAPEPQNAAARSDEHTELTIESATWYSEAYAGGRVAMRLDDPDTAGHVLVHVREHRPGEGIAQYAEFYRKVGKDFRLTAEGRPDVPLRATRGYWVIDDLDVRDFYLRIEPSDFATVAAGVPYRLVALNGHARFRWIVADGVVLIRPDEATPAAAAIEALTIDRLAWSDSEEWPSQLREEPLVLLARIAEPGDFDELKAFTAKVDQRFYVEAPGNPTLSVAHGTGGFTRPKERWIMLPLGPADLRDLRKGVAYTLRPRNGTAAARWQVKEGLSIRR